MELIHALVLVWVMVVLVVRWWRPNAHPLIWDGLLLALIVPLLMTTLVRDFGTADTFEFQVTAPKLGIAHPTGYPLYLILGKLWTLIPFGTVAGRLNFGTMVYAIITAWLLSRTIRDVWHTPAVGVLIGAIFVTLPTVWGQAIEAEVYTLHALIVTVCLHVMLTRKSAVYLAFALGLGLTNHLTTVLLFPAALLYVVYVARKTFTRKRMIRIVTAFILPLMIYAYLPIRWAAVRDDRLGLWGFIDYVTARQFAGALRWDAFYSDAARWGIVGRLFLNEWTWVGAVALTIAIVVTIWCGRFNGWLLLITVAAFTFYALNYYVPDLNVFLLPAHLAMSIVISVAMSILPSPSPSQKEGDRSPSLWGGLRGGILLALGLFLAFQIGRTYPTLSTQPDNRLRQWGTATLNSDLAPSALILADSHKYPPLYYLQQAEEIREDLTISSYHLEEEYRVALDAAVASNQPVYLARYLPRLPYALGSAGTLIQVEPPIITPTTAPLATIENIDLYTVDIAPISAWDETQSAVTFHWHITKPITTNHHIYLRWEGIDRTVGKHPVNDSYPTAAWRTNNIITDFHHIPRPNLAKPTKLNLQVAFAPSFTLSDQLNWHTIDTATLPPYTVPPASNDIIQLPPSTYNYANTIALYDTIDVDINSDIDITLRWQRLTKIDSDYTVSVQLLDENDMMLSQIDLAPVQGTYPTSQWKEGEIVTDSYTLPYDDAADHIYIILYSLADGRLHILDGNSNPIDDKVTIPLPSAFHLGG